jgi:uncharacterized protein YjbJ (UPF0337 family)
VRQISTILASQKARGKRQEARGKAKGKRQEARGKRQEAKGKRQEARGKRQEARGKRQEARGKRQEARGKRQEARGKRQEARGKSEEGLGDFTFLYTVWFYCVHLLISSLSVFSVPLWFFCSFIGIIFYFLSFHNDYHYLFWDNLFLGSPFGEFSSSTFL